MDLGLSLGDASNTVDFFRSTDHHHQKPTKMNGLDFCMTLGLTGSSPAPASAKTAQEIDEDDETKNLQLILLPVNPVRQIKSHLQSSDNGSSETKAPPPPPEEASSANSGDSPMIHMDFGMYRGTKRSSSPSPRPSDDDEENGINARKKLRLSKQQSAFLEESFKEQSTLNPKQKLALARQLNLRPRQVEVWFQNRRARTKLKQTEVDCEYLKKCCETLTEENRRLQKELQELRALKTTNPFYMQLPATTLTMCPSCERVATASATASFPRFDSFSKAPTHSND